MGDMSMKNGQGGYRKRFLKCMLFHSYQYKSMSWESQTFGNSSSILDDVQTSQKEILDEWYVKQKLTSGLQKTIFGMYAFFNIINIDLCQGNPRLLPNLITYWMMSRHPKRKSQMGGMSNKNGQGGYRRRFLKCMLFSQLSIQVHVTGIPDFFPTLLPYCMMCRYPKRKSQRGGMQNKNGTWGYRRHFLIVGFF